MSSEMLMRAGFAAAFSAAFSWAAFSRFDREIGSDAKAGEGVRYSPYMCEYLFPLFLLVIDVLCLAHYGIHATKRMMLSLCFEMLIQLSGYYIVLAVLMPFLRRFICARACAMLWMLPNYLYVMQSDFMELPSPRFVITVSGSWIWIAFYIWFAGFALIMLWKIAEHLVFRRRILKNAAEVTDTKVLAVWCRTIEEARIKKPKFKLVVSPAVRTPLSVGLFKRAVRVVLPGTEYSETELELILRHEIVHIAREDAWYKFFLLFCKAMCWFDPLVWFAMRKSAEDLEMSCDETVLLEESEERRRQYAALILNSAGDEHGFTTCLSANARAMRRRLRGVARPAKRGSGAVIIGLVFFALCMSCGHIALAYDGGSGAELIFASGSAEEYTLRSVSEYEDEYNTVYDTARQNELTEYLSGLTLYSLSGNYSFSDSEHDVSFIFDGPKGTLVCNITDSAVKVVPLYGEAKSRGYYVSGGVDWDYISGLIPAHPALRLTLSRGDGNGKSKTNAKLVRLWDGGESVYENDDAEEYGIFGSIQYDSASLSFSQTPTLPCTVLVETWDRTGSYTAVLNSPGDVLELPEYSVHLTITARFDPSSGESLLAQFCVDIGGPDDEWQNR